MNLFLMCRDFKEEVSFLSKLNFFFLNGPEVKFI